jgi:hypothetical protein
MPLKTYHLALHKYQVMHGILFEGLDPALARQGLFGAGTYFAEDAAKVLKCFK